MLKTFRPAGILVTVQCKMFLSYALLAVRRVCGLVFREWAYCTISYHLDIPSVYALLPVPILHSSPAGIQASPYSDDTDVPLPSLPTDAMDEYLAYTKHLVEVLGKVQPISVFDDFPFSSLISH
jgi:hypothetical protein